MIRTADGDCMPGCRICGQLVRSFGAMSSPLYRPLSSVPSCPQIIQLCWSPPDPWCSRQDKTQVGNVLQSWGSCGPGDLSCLGGGVRWYSYLFSASLLWLFRSNWGTGTFQACFWALQNMFSSLWWGSRGRGGGGQQGVGGTYKAWTLLFCHFALVLFWLLL